MPTDREAAAQAELREIAAELEAAQARLQAVHDSLPVSAREPVMLLGEEDPDVATEVRSVVECVLSDSLEPAIRDLRTAAAYRAGRGEEL